MTENSRIPPGLLHMIIADLPNHCAAICRDVLLESGEMTFCIGIVATETEVQTLLLPVPNHETEAAIARGLRRHLKEHGAVAYGVCVEGWIRFTSDAGLAEAPPSEHPDGVEAVLIMGSTVDRPFHCFFRIARDADGKITGLGEDLVAGRAPPTTGIFMGLLEPEPLVH